MSAIKILSYVPQPYGDYQLGFCRVDVAEKFLLTLKVMKNKDGHPYCAFMSAKIGNAWVPCMIFSSEEQHKRFFSECNSQIKPLIAPPKQEFNSSYPSMDEPEETQGVPF
jgi:hypothetical protein